MHLRSIVYILLSPKPITTVEHTKRYDVSPLNVVEILNFIAGVTREHSPLELEQSEWVEFVPNCWVLYLSHRNAVDSNFWFKPKPSQSHVDSTILSVYSGWFNRVMSRCNLSWILENKVPSNHLWWEFLSEKNRVWVNANSFIPMYSMCIYTS